jgi:hypothetical protein
MAVFPARLLGVKSMSQSTGLLFDEGVILEALRYCKDLDLVDWSYADIVQYEEGCVNRRKRRSCQVKALSAQFKGQVI